MKVRSESPKEQEINFKQENYMISQIEVKVGTILKLEEFSRVTITSLSQGSSNIIHLKTIISISAPKQPQSEQSICVQNFVTILITKLLE